MMRGLRKELKKASQNIEKSMILAGFASLGDLKLLLKIAIFVVFPANFKG